MKREERISEPELAALIERGRTIRPLPDVVRARALARARATVAAAAVEAPAPAPAAAAPAPVATRRIALAAEVEDHPGALADHVPRRGARGEAEADQTHHRAETADRNVLQAAEPR